MKSLFISILTAVLISSFTFLNGCTVGHTDEAADMKSPLENKTYFMEKGVISHAGGYIDGYTVTNAPEAFEAAYERGHRFFEADINLTSDNELVCSHGWGHSDYVYRFGHVNKPTFYQPAIEEFKAYIVGRDYGVWTFSDLVEWVKGHKDAHVHLDIKECDYDTAKHIAEQIRLLAGEESLLQRFVMSARTPDMLRGFRDAGEFPWLHMLYAGDSVRDATISTPEDFLEFCQQNRVSSLSISLADYTEKVAEKFSSSGLKTMVYMIQNSLEAETVLQMGADFLISDFLTPDIIDRLETRGG